MTETIDEPRILIFRGNPDQRLAVGDTFVTGGKRWTTLSAIDRYNDHSMVCGQRLYAEHKLRNGEEHCEFITATTNAGQTLARMRGISAEMVPDSEPTRMRDLYIQTARECLELLEAAIEANGDTQEYAEMLLGAAHMVLKECRRVR